MNTLTVLLIGIIVILAIALVVSLATRPKVLTLSDDLPKGSVTRYAVMKLQDELRDYIYIKDGRICINIVEEKTDNL